LPEVFDLIYESYNYLIGGNDMPKKESVGSFDETATKAREEFAKLLGALSEEETNGTG
jgi:hypothetical protein